MEPVTHFLTGACLSRAGLNRKTGLATLTLVLASEMPDLDIVSSLGGSVSYLQHHRGITHTLLGAPFVAAGTLGVVYGIYRLLLSRGHEFKRPPNWRLLYLYALFSALLHIFLDFTNSYGIRPFAPFSWKWYSWDILFILDPVLLAVLVLGLVIPPLLGLISDEIGARKSVRGRGGAIFALVFFLAVIYVRDFEHRRAVNILTSLTYRDEEPLRASAYPTLFNPFEWIGVVETRDFFTSGTANPRQGTFEADDRLPPHYKGEETAVTLAAKKSRLGGIYLDWAQYPVVEAERLPDEKGYKVRFVDWRFIRISSDRQSFPLAGYVILDSKLNVVDMSVGGPSPQRPEEH
ncbi:MAG TPA: metal-dependent hydrolase [Candidatus Angelobacter sp.]